MANYYAKHLSSYFSVTDADKLKEIIASCQADAEIEVFGKTMPDGTFKHGFGCLGSIYGIPEYGEDDAGGIETLYASLQKILPPGEAIIITEIGYEKLCYFIALCTIITHDEIKYLDARQEAVKIAGIMLGNPEFCPELDY